MCFASENVLQLQHTVVAQFFRCSNAQFEFLSEFFMVGLALLHSGDCSVKGIASFGPLRLAALKRIFQPIKDNDVTLVVLVASVPSLANYVHIELVRITHTNVNEISHGPSSQLQ